MSRWWKDGSTNLRQAWQQGLPVQPKNVWTITELNGTISLSQLYLGVWFYSKKKQEADILNPETHQISNCQKVQSHVKSRHPPLKTDGVRILGPKRNPADQFLSQGETINSVPYCENLKCSQAIQNKRSGMLTRSVRLLDDNTSAYHRSFNNCTVGQVWLESLHPTIIQSLAFFVYHLFTKVKEWLARKHFHSNK